MRVRAWVALMSLVAGWWPLAALAGDGRIELSQASVEASGGFPFTIAAPGSYLLTSDLVVPADTDALILAADGVILDLNGFAIRGPSTCDTGSCALGTGDGISRPGGPSPGGSRAGVSGGTVSGFTGSCVIVGDESAVSDLLVHDCGFRGIIVGQRSLVRGNRVLETGLEGMSMGARSAFANNVVAMTGLGGGGNVAILGGRATGGNVCDDGSCSAYAPMRRFYLTPGTFTGDLPDEPGTCAPGFHFASVWEILDPSQLKYDTTLGLTNVDSGSGPPSEQGWVRSADLNTPGNCDNWTTGNTLSPGGPTVRLAPQSDWADPGVVTSPWQGGGGGVSGCSAPRHVWCLED